MELPSSLSSTESHPKVEVGIEGNSRGKLRFTPFVDYLEHAELLAIFRMFIRAVREQRGEKRVVGQWRVEVPRYDPASRSGATVRLARDDLWVRIHPIDFLMVFFDHIGPGDPPYKEIMDVLLPYIHGGSGTVEERARVCLNGIANERRNANE